MSLRINTNIEAFNAHRNLSATAGQLARSMQRLSSGMRINSAADDAAGLGISERMRAQVSGLAQAQRNAQDGISMVQAAEGAMGELTSILHRVRDLAVQWANGIYDDGSRAAITAEVAQLSAEIDRLISVARFNGVALLSSAPGAPLATLQVGANAGETVAIAGVNVPTAIGQELSIFASATFNRVIDIDSIDQAISNIATLRASFGAVQNRLEHTLASLSVTQENLQAAESRIRDVDMAEEMTELVRLQVLQQSGTAMLAQANQASASVLQLLS